MKVIVSVIVIALLVGGIAYFKLMPSGNEGTIATNQISGDGDDMDVLLASLDQEQSEETSLLATGDVENSILAEESSLLGEINKINQDEL